jgi:hypothetical protein
MTHYRAARKNELPDFLQTEVRRLTGLLLPGALLVTIQAQLFAPFVFVDFCLAAFF